MNKDGLCRLSVILLAVTVGCLFVLQCLHSMKHEKLAPNVHAHASLSLDIEESDMVERPDPEENYLLYGRAVITDETFEPALHAHASQKDMERMVNRLNYTGSIHRFYWFEVAPTPQPESNTDDGQEYFIYVREIDTNRVTRHKRTLRETPDDMEREMRRLNKMRSGKLLHWFEVKDATK